MKLTINSAPKPATEERETYSAPPKWENGDQAAHHAPLGTNEYGDLSNNCEYVASKNTG